MKKPNIVFLICDCLRTKNANSLTMPYIVGKSKIEFTRCYSPSTWTLPSYASIYSIKTPVDHNITRRGDYLNRNLSVLPYNLKKNGYHTCAFTENPTYGSNYGFHRGIDFFDEDINYKKYPSSTSFLRMGGFKGLIKNFPKTIRQSNSRFLDFMNFCYLGLSYFNYERKSKSIHNSERILNHISMYLKNNSDNPKLILTNFLEPHSPYMSSERGADLLGLSFSKEEKESLANFDARNYLLKNEKPPTANNGEEVFSSWSDFFSRQIDAYNSQIRYLDEQLEKWFKTNEEFLRNSLVILTGDHGQLFGEEEMYGHHTSLHPNGVNVPLYIFPPENDEFDTGKFSEPVSLIGVSEAVSQLVNGKVKDIERFIELVKEESKLGDEGEVIITVDGPTWNIKELEKKYNYEKVERLKIRKIGFVKKDKMRVYSSYWNSPEIIHREYTIEEYDRTLLKEDRNTEKLNEKFLNWLQYPSGDARRIKSSVNRLKRENRIRF
ncbi:MAG: sulfatase-like hydrolase/transferase [Petrotogales bacterium]